MLIFSVTSWQFERLKKQTQEDIKNTLDQLLEVMSALFQMFTLIM